MVIALICPDGLSTLLFCSGILRAFATIPDTRVIVVTDVAGHRQDIEALGVECISIPMARFVDPAKDVKYLWRLYSIFRQERCDVVFNVSTKPNIYGPIAARFARVRHVYSNVLGLGVNFLPATTVSARMLQVVVRALYHLACVWTDKLWFTNANDLQILLDHGWITKEKAILTRFWVDIDAYKAGVVDSDAAEAARRELGLAPTDKLVLMVARLIWPKGVREFIDAAELLRTRHPELKFLLVAPPENGSRDAVPVSYVRERESLGNFKWLDFQKDVKRLYAICDLAVLPSYYKEGGYPRALQEPMAMGKAVITTDSPDCRATVEDGRNGYLVPIRDPKALAEAISRLIGDPVKLAAFGRYSRLKVERELNERDIVNGALIKLGLPVSA